MNPEVVANLWSFIHGPFLYEIGVRLYMIAGSDDDKFAFLNKLAGHDFHFSRRFELGDNYKVHLVGAPSPLDKPMTRLIPTGSLGYGGPGLEYIDWFQAAFDAIEKDLPTQSIGIAGAGSSRAPFDRNNLLNVHTFINVDSDGNQIPKITNRSPQGQPTKLLINLWALSGQNPQEVAGISGRAYLAGDTTAGLNAALAALAPNDFRLATPVAVTDATVASLTSNDHKVTFKSVLDQLENTVPLGHLDWERTKTTKFPFRRDEATFNVTHAQLGSGGSATVRPVASKPWWKLW